MKHKKEEQMHEVIKLFDLIVKAIKKKIHTPEVYHNYNYNNYTVIYNYIVSQS